LIFPHMDYISWSLALKGKQPLEEVLILTILVLIVLAIPIAPLYMLYVRLMGDDSFIKLVYDSHFLWATWESLEKGFCLTLVAGILFLRIIKTLQWKQRSKHGWDWRPRVQSLSCGVNLRRGIDSKCPCLCMMIINLCLCIKDKKLTNLWRRI
jgi:hypothetical protein